VDVTPFLQAARCPVRAIPANPCVSVDLCKNLFFVHVFSYPRWRLYYLVVLPITQEVVLLGLIVWLVAKVGGDLVLGLVGEIAVELAISAIALLIVGAVLTVLLHGPSSFSVEVCSLTEG